MKRIYIISGILLIVLDQLVKLLLQNKDITLIPNGIRLTYIENAGTAFSYIQNNIGIIITLNIIILIGIIIFIIIKRAKIKNLTFLSLILILSGGISNLIDRIVKGYVVDYINIEFLNFPIFNIADISIVTGIILLIFCICREMKQD